MIASFKPPRQITLHMWLALLTLGLSFWFIINHINLLMEILWIFFGAILLSLGIRPIANRLSHWHIPRDLTTIIVYIVLLAVLILIGALLAPVVSNELSRLKTGGPQLLETAISRLAAMPVVGSLFPTVETLTQSLVQRLDVLLTTALGTAVSIGEVALDLFITLVLAYFFATDQLVGERLLCQWVPERHQVQIRTVATRVLQRLSRWVWAQLAVAFYFAFSFSLGLSLLGVPFAFSIGLAGGILEVIPYLGGIVAVSLAILSALSMEPILALWVIIFYAVVVQIEAHLISPAFFGRVMGLHPAFVLLALMIGAKLEGVVGVLFAVPFAVVLTAVLQEALNQYKSENEEQEDT